VDRVLDRLARFEEAGERAHASRRGGGVVGERIAGPRFTSTIMAGEMRG
jgi:hypothetical protein